MATVKNVRVFGNQLVVTLDDGSRSMAVPTGQDMWVFSNGVTFVPNPSNPGGGVVTPPPPVAGTYAVIFPCDVHNVSDSFQAHKDRGSVNPGTDYTASYGSKVVSVANGVVIDITNTIGGSGGRMIHIDNDDGSGADYLHLSDATSFVSVGQHVTQGQQIALSGASGLGSNHGYGAHLHISYRLNHNHGYSGAGNIDFDAYVRSLGLR